jgi:hypothetical protein
MTTAYTSLLGLALPVDGELTGTWGQVVNNSITSLLDTAIAGTKTADVTSSNWTLTDIDGADDTARAAVLIPTGTNGATTRSILAPNQSKIYVVINQATGSVVVKGVTGPTTGVTILSGKTALVAWNGSDFIEITPSTISSTLPVASGGTGATTLTGVLKGNGTSAFTAATSGTDYSAGTSALATGILKSTTATGALTIAVAADFPSLNQNTTGTAAGLSTTLSIASGGTNSTATPTAGGAGYGTGTAHAYTAAGTAGQVLTSQGAAAPTWTTLTSSGGTVTSVSGTGTVSGLTLSGTVTSSGSLTLGGSITGFLPTAGGTMTGNIVFNAGQPLGTPSSGTLSSCTVDGTNAVGYKNIPLSGIKTASYTLVAGDVGKFIELGTSGSVVVPASVFAAGDAISIFNNTSASISCTCSAVTTVYKGGTDADISSFSVTTRGVATILFITATVAVITGNLA